jgi:signal transduction histidine kinase
MDGRFPASRAFASELGIHSIFSYPLMAGATIYGALLLCSPEPGGFTPLKSDILSLFASQATIAIHNGLLIESAHQRASFQQAIEQLEYVQRHNLNDRELLARVYAQSRQTFGVSLSSMLQFISEHMLTLSERNLHDTLYSVTQEPLPFVEAVESTQSGEAHPLLFTTPKQWKANEGVLAYQEESVAYLTQTAEAALARAKEFSELSHALSQLKQTPEHMKDALFAVDPGGHCIYMNPAAEVFCGMHISTTGIPVEKAFAEVYPRIRNIDEVSAYFQGYKQGIAYTRELRCLLALEPVRSFDKGDQAPSTFLTSSSLTDANAISTLLGRSRTSFLPDAVPTDSYYQFIAFPLFDRQGKLIANGLQIHNVTEQVREEKIKAALLSSVSHELRTPLTTIKMAVSGLLQTGNEWDERAWRELLEEVNAETDHLAVLVDAIVEMSRIEMGVLVLDKTWCDVVEILDGALTRLKRKCDTRCMRLDIPQNLPLIYVDHVQMEHVFTHLLENALHYSPEGAEIHINLETFYECDDVSKQQYLRASVIDHRVEVLPGERDRVFKSFYGGNEYGMGLGLAISRGIIEAHQGKIRVEDAPDDSGCCFTFTLPVFPNAGNASLYENNTELSLWQYPLVAATEKPQEQAVSVAVSSLLQTSEEQS